MIIAQYAVANGKKTRGQVTLQASLVVECNQSCTAALRARAVDLEQTLLNHYANSGLPATDNTGAQREPADWQAECRNELGLLALCLIHT